MQPESRAKRGINKRTLLAAVLFLIVMPATLACGILFLKDKKYYIVCLLLIVYAMLPFFFLFENRRPQARELVVIAVLCAIGVAGRAAFFMVPQFKPVAAVVILAGVCFGAESGFLVGAMTAFVSNFFFGQGPWTPWQMFAFGLIGFLAGLLFKEGRLPRKRLPLCAFGAVAILVLYGRHHQHQLGAPVYRRTQLADRRRNLPGRPPLRHFTCPLDRIFPFCADQSHAGKAGTHPQEIRTIARIKAF